MEMFRNIFIKRNNSLQKLFNFDELFEWGISILIIFSTFSIYSIFINIDFNFTTIIFVFLFIWIIYLFIQKNINKVILKKIVVFLILYELFITFFFFLNNVISKGNYIVLFFLILPELIIIFTCSKSKINIGRRILKKYCIIIFFIACISLFLYLLGSISDLIKPTNTVKVQWNFERNFYNYFYIFFETQYFKMFGYEFARNTAIFPESPIYVLHLITCLSAYVYIFKEKSYLKYTVLALTIITTFSTIGISLLGLIFMDQIIFRNLQIQKKYILICSGLITLIIVSFFLVQRMNTSSFTMRIDDYLASLRAWLDHMIIGNGYDNKAAIIKYMIANRVDNGLSNSFFTLLSDGGLYFTSLYLIPTILIIRRYFVLKNYDYLKFILILIIMFLCIIFEYTPLMIFFLSFSISSILKNI